MVDLSSTIRRGHPIAFGALLLFSLISAIIASALTSNYRSGNDASTGTSQGVKDKVHFSVFTAWWTVVLGAVYLGCFLAGVGGVLTSIASHLGFLFITWIFWVAAAGSLTAELNGGQNCSTSPLYYCNALQALMAFDWINWIIVTIMFFAVIAIAAGAFRGGRGLKGEMA